MYKHTYQYIVFSVASIFCLSLFVATIAYPVPAHAVQKEADAMCITARDYTLLCGQINPKTHVPGGRLCPCNDFTNGGSVSGVCTTALKCLGKTATGLGGGPSTSVGAGSLSSLLQSVGQIVSSLLGGGGGGGGGDSGSGGGGGGTDPTCNYSGQTYSTSAGCACPSGQVPSSSTMSCVSSTSNTNCSFSGQTYSSITGSCTCPVGKTPSYETMSCVTSNSTTCTVGGQTFSSLTGVCSCPSGKRLSTDGTSCVATVSTGCPITGQEYSSTTQSCSCPIGKKLTDTGTSCVAVLNTICTIGGQIYTTSTSACMCPIGKTLSEDGASCVAANTNTCSVNGQTYSNTSHSCSCLTGKKLSVDGKSCVVVVNESTQSNITGTYIVIASSTNPVFSQTQSGYQQGQTTGYFDQNGGNRGTLVVRTYDQQNNSETAAFYGSNTYKNGASALVGGWCHNRPWSSNFLGSLFSISFFDGLCRWAGYDVGAPTPVKTTLPPRTYQSPHITPIKRVVVQPQATTTVATTSPLITPRVTIWAVPSKVTLGSRTTVFWNTQGVSNCTISSPDGSFHQTTLAGGGSTVPLTGATTFTISCLDYSQNPVTDYVTVNIAH